MRAFGLLAAFARGFVAGGASAGFVSGVASTAGGGSNLAMNGPKVSRVTGIHSTDASYVQLGPVGRDLAIGTEQLIGDVAFDVDLPVRLEALDFDAHEVAPDTCGMAFIAQSVQTRRAAPDCSISFCSSRCADVSGCGGGSGGSDWHPATTTPTTNTLRESTRRPSERAYGGAHAGR